MKKIIFAAAAVVLTSASAFAQSSALDVAVQQTVDASSAVIATTELGENRDRLGDGSPAPVFSSDIDYTATASIGGEPAGVAIDVRRGLNGSE